MQEGGVLVSFQGSSGGDLLSGTSVFGAGDFKITDQMVACAVKNQNVDPKRIFTTGCSAGGLFAGAMGAARSNYIAAAAPNSGGYTTPGITQFQGKVAPALMTVHGAPGSDERSSRATVWQYGWTALGYAATGTFIAIAATTNNPDDRLDFTFAAVGSLLDTGIHVVGSIQVHAASRLREQPDGEPAQLRKKWQFAERELAAAAEAERERSSPLKAHLLPVGLSVMSGLVLGLVFGHWKGAAINTAAAVVVNEARVLTQPTSTVEALHRYQQDSNMLAQRMTRSRWQCSS
ncbi:MAG TPA: hypothetical protein VFN67_28470 [Polyangiales bacterium]|nr:hypothetical protein [Polyangiales bacterium]